MPIKKTIWVAKSGRVFDTEVEANRDETATDLSSDLARVLDKMGADADPVLVRDALAVVMSYGWAFTDTRPQPSEDRG